MRWVLVVPVKRLEVAKTRLDGLGSEARAELALAFALDTIGAALAAERVRAVVAVSDDPRAAEAIRGLGVEVLPDEPDAGLVPALLHGVRHAVHRHPGSGVGALSADLPALRPAELDEALRLGEEACERSPASSAMVADQSGTGTTLLLADGVDSFAPRFGPRSRARHRAAGVVEVDVAGVHTVRRDVDTEVDLDDAVRLGVGPRTAAVLARLDDPGNGKGPFPTPLRR